MKRFISIFLTVLLCVTLITTLALAQNPDIYVDANEGNDKVGDGSQDNPYQTITKAVQVANDSMGHEKIHVAKGVYNLNTGEKFPLTVKNVDLVGKTDDLEAVKIATQMTFKNSTVKGFHFYRSVEAQDGTVIQGNAFSGINGDAISLRIEGSSKIRGNSFKDNERAISGGITSGSLTVNNNTLLNNSQGARISLSRGGGVAIVANQVKAAERGSGFSIHLRGGESRAIVQSNEITARAGVGVFFGRGGGKALIPDNTISSDETGIVLDLNDSGGEVVLANNKISGQNSVSFTGSGNVKADLGGGPSEKSGNNTFQASEYCIKYELPPYNGKIYAENNTWKDAYGNTFQPPATLEGPADTDHFLIKDEGNKIVFSD